MPGNKISNAPEQFCSFFYAFEIVGYKEDDMEVRESKASTEVQIMCSLEGG